MEKSKFVQLREDERRVRKALILDATIKLFSKKSFDEIGMRDIAEEAGISAASLYRYFPSQENLFVEAFIQELYAIQKALDHRLRDLEQNGGVSLERFALEVVDYLMDNESTFQMMSYLMTKGHQMPLPIIGRFIEVRRSFIDQVDEVFGMSGYKTNSRLLSHAFFASLTGVLMNFRNDLGREKEDVRRKIHNLIKLVAAIFVHGATPAMETLETARIASEH